MFRLGKRFKAYYLYIGSSFDLAVFGASTRFEPNFANVAMTSLGLLCLVESSIKIESGRLLGIGLVLH